MVQQLRQHVPDEVFRQIRMDYHINKLDPDFSFYKAVFGEDPKPVPSFADSLTRRS